MIKSNVDRAIKVFQIESGLDFGEFKIQILSSLTKVDSRIICNTKTNLFDKIIGRDKKITLQLSEKFVNGIYTKKDFYGLIGHELAHIYLYQKNIFNQDNSLFTKVCKRLGLSSKFWTDDFKLDKNDTYYNKVKYVDAFVGYCTGCGNYVTTVFKEEDIKRLKSMHTCCCGADVEFYLERVPVLRNR